MKHFISFLIAVFVFYSVGTEFALAATYENNKKQLVDTQKASDETINNEKIDSEAGELFGESIDENNLDTKSEIHGNEATVKTSIETEDLSVNGKLDLDLADNNMIVTADAEDDSGKLFSGEFNVQLLDINDEGDFLATLTNTETGEEYNVNTAEVHASWYPLVWIAIVVARIGIKQAIKKFGKASVKQATKKYGTKTSASKAVRKVSMSRLDAHYSKHKKEFGNITKSQYLNKARTFLGKATSKTVLEKRSKKKFGGKYRYYKYNKKTNEFLSVERSGNKDTIITYFKPKHPNKKAGYNYYKNQ